MNSLDRRQYSDMIDEVVNYVRDTSDATREAAENAMNRCLSAVAAQIEWPELVESDESGVRQYGDATLPSLMVGDAYFPVPWDVARIKSIHFQTIDGMTIDLVEPAEGYRRAGTSLATSGKPLAAWIAGITAQHVRAAAGNVTLFCTSSANDNAKSVRVEYYRQNGFPSREAFQEVQGAFSTGVVIDSMAAGYPIRVISVPAGWIGDITATDSAGTTIVSIQSTQQPTQADSTYQIVTRMLLRAWPIPDANYPLTMVFWKRPRRLTQDADVPAMPVSAYLIEKTTAEILQRQGKLQQASVHENAAQQFLMAVAARGKQVTRTTIAPYMGNFVYQNGLVPGSY